MPTIGRFVWRPVCASLCFLACGAHAAAQQYAVTDLGTLPGNRVSVGYALNDSGEAAGVSSTPTAAIAAMFEAGKATSISTLGANVSVATGINAGGEIVGYNIFYSGPNLNPQAFLSANGVMRSIDSPSLFPSGSEAWAINNSGEVVGTGYLSSSNFHAFLYSNGRMNDLGPPGSYQASAVAINTSGQIVGSNSLASGGGGAFLYSSGKTLQLPVPAGSSAVAAFAINDNGEIAGALYFSSGAPPHAATYANGAWTDLGAFPGAIASLAKGINLAGEVVGTAYFRQTQYHPPKPGKHVPFIYSSGALIDLNTLISPGAGFTLTDAIGINGSGEILCNATNTGGNEHAVLLTPR